ncbi:hypothetical protein IGI04_023747, partial [Brassica rapa subsp. trilocularis]
MVETRLQERSLTEQVDEIRSLHDLLASEVKTQSDSMNSRFDRLEAMMFNHISAIQATGKAPMDPGPSHPPTPIPNNPDQNPPPTPFTHSSHHLPDPPDPFSHPPRQNYAELVALKQGSDSVVDYRDKFETAWMRLVLPEAHALSIFLANMNPHLSLHTRQFEVTTISGSTLNKLMLQEPQIALIQIREVTTENTEDDNFTP